MDRGAGMVGDGGCGIGARRESDCEGGLVGVEIRFWSSSSVETMVHSVGNSMYLRIRVAPRFVSAMLCSSPLGRD